MAKMNYSRKHNRTLTSVFSEAGNPYASRNISAEVRGMEADLRHYSSQVLKETLEGYKSVLRALPARPTKGEAMSDKAFIEQVIKLILAIMYERGEIKA